jgi:uncharacterized membrane-anchored protein
MKKIFLLFIMLFAASSLLFAKNDTDSTKVLLEQIQQYAKLMDSVNKVLKYETGKVSLPAGIASLNIVKGFKYLGKEQSKYVVEELWGNLPQEGLQGMLFPGNSGPFADSSYGYIITYKEMGFVKDKDAKTIDYDDLMKGMKKDDEEENKKRIAAGVQPLYMVGWAAKPFYDEEKKVMHWATELRTEAAENTLNYQIIMLGRKGILTMNAIASISQLNKVKADVDKVLNAAQFNEGNQYKNFDSKVDNVAAWTVGGLVAGKVLAKVGFLAKFWKFIVMGFAALGGWFVKLFKKKKEEQFVYEPTPAPPANDEPVAPQP